MVEFINIKGKGVEEALSDMERAERCKEHFLKGLEKFRCFYTPTLAVDPQTGFIKFTGLQFIPAQIVKLPGDGDHG